MIMKKNTKTIFAILIILALMLNYTTVFAAPPEKPSGEMPSSNGGTYTSHGICGWNSNNIYKL